MPLSELGDGLRHEHAVVSSQMGRSTVSGALMTALRSTEKKMACLDRPG